MKNALLTILIVTIACILILLIIEKSKNFKMRIDDYASCINYGLNLGIVLGIGLVVALFLITLKSTTHIITKVEEQKIISMQFNNSISGKFLLGTGNVNNTDYVVFYTRKGNKIIRNKEEAKNVKIISDNKNPRVIITQQSQISNFKCIFGEDNIKLDMPQKIEFYIPEKSIIENIKLN